MGFDAPDLPGDDNDFNGFGMPSQKGVFDENSDFGQKQTNAHL